MNRSMLNLSPAELIAMATGRRGAERLEQTGEIVGIPLIDNIIVAGEKAISIQEWRSGNQW